MRVSVVQVGVKEQEESMKDSMQEGKQEGRDRKKVGAAEIRTEQRRTCGNGTTSVLFERKSSTRQQQLQTSTE